MLSQWILGSKSMNPGKHGEEKDNNVSSPDSILMKWDLAIAWTAKPPLLIALESGPISCVNIIRKDTYKCYKT